MAQIIPFPQPTTPTLHGPAQCLSCGYRWGAVTPEGCIAALTCPNCGFDHGVLRSLVEPEADYWRCACGSYLFYLLADGCQCLMCGILQAGF